MLRLNTQDFPCTILKQVQLLLFLSFSITLKEAQYLMGAPNQLPSSSRNLTPSFVLCSRTLSPAIASGDQPCKRFRSSSFSPGSHFRSRRALTNRPNFWKTSLCSSRRIFTPRRDHLYDQGQCQDTVLFGICPWMLIPALFPTQHTVVLDKDCPIYLNPTGVSITGRP